MELGNVQFGLHARLRAVERRLDPVWIERLVATPDWIETDPIRPWRLRIYGYVPELRQILRVVIERAGEGSAWEIVTVFPDRHAWKRRRR